MVVSCSHCSLALRNVCLLTIPTDYWFAIHLPKPVRYISHFPSFLNLSKMPFHIYDLAAVECNPSSCVYVYTESVFFIHGRINTKSITFKNQLHTCLYVEPFTPFWAWNESNCHLIATAWVFKFFFLVSQPSQTNKKKSSKN